MQISETQNYAALLAKKAELAAEQAANGAQTPAAQALGNEAWDLLASCCKEAGIPFPH